MKAAPLSWDVTRMLFAVVAIGGLTAASFWVLRPFLPSAIWAVMIVIATWPEMRAVQRRLWGRRSLAVAVMTLVMIASILGPVAVAVATLVGRADARDGPRGPRHAAPHGHRPLAHQPGGKPPHALRPASPHGGDLGGPVREGRGGRGVGAGIRAPPGRSGGRARSPSLRSGDSRNRAWHRRHRAGAGGGRRRRPRDHRRAASRAPDGDHVPARRGAGRRDAGAGRRRDLALLAGPAA